ncbi:zf-RVT domain-containing protein [Cephalotus follicularis]|uniref:Zf-RVT domain-containing protein n=1 Tax=Cephalotus follicularis TaxID=3775 RepID=A0A1Q3DJ68_CEPFO|nr:zf-RVT domain-containing protein [Cephalotus follicularis]
MEHKQTLSVTWRYLLKLRPVVSSNLVYTVGLNSAWSIWYDPWFQGIPLFEKVGERAIYDSGLPLNATLSEVLLDTNWDWPPHVWQLREIDSACTNIPIKQRDSIGWRREGGSFSHKSAWDSLRPAAPMVPWAKVVWFSGAIPKHSFCLWLTFRKAHLTLDKLQAFGVVQQSLCPFGCGLQETIDHLFFACAFTKLVWSKVMELNNCPPLSDWNWDSTATWALGHARGSHLRGWLRRAGLATAVYHCWRERNDRIFRQLASPPSHLIERIVFDVAKKAALHLKIQDTPSNRALGENWGIDECAFFNNAHQRDT